MEKNMSWIIGKPEFIDNLDKWVANNKQQNADWLKRNKNGIPPMFRSYSQFLYRGMSVDDLQYIQENGLVFKNNTSWTKDEKLAKAFINDPKYRVSTAKGSIGLLIKKKIPTSKIILDIAEFYMFMGAAQLEMLGIDEMSVDSMGKAKEVLVEGGIKITAKDIIKL